MLRRPEAVERITEKEKGEEAQGSAPFSGCSIAGPLHGRAAGSECARTMVGVAERMETERSRKRASKEARPEAQRELVARLEGLVMCKLSARSVH